MSSATQSAPTGALLGAHVSGARIRDTKAIPAVVAASNATPTRKHEYAWSSVWPMLLCHLAVFGACWTGVSVEAAITCVVLYAVRMFGITAGYHRYFAHRTYKTSRVMQFILAFIAQATAQRGALWWAAHHRAHHLYSDGEKDLHSPVQDGFWHSHILWLFEEKGVTDWKRIKDFAKYPELRFLNTYFLLPPVIVGVAVFLLFGWSGLWIGFFLSTVLTWHCTFFINSLSHVWGKRRWNTKDDSRNNPVLALICFGEGWHNNHHHYMNSCRQGFYWWEFDITYYILKVMSWVGLVWDIKEPPARVLEQGRKLDLERQNAT